jgi:hypothetical protein
MWQQEIEAMVMSQPLLTIIKSNYAEALQVISDTTDPELKSYYEGRRDVLSELLITLNIMEQK